VGEQTIPLPDGRVLHATFEAEAERWTAWLGDDRDRLEVGESLVEVVYELLDITDDEPAWIDDVLRSLSTAAGRLFACPCCGFLTLFEPPPDTYAICKVCFWEDDGVQFDDPDFRGGANAVSLNEARENYRRLGVSEPRFREYVRPPFPEEDPSRG
jgi:hypothetical protein